MSLTMKPDPLVMFCGLKQKQRRRDVCLEATGLLCFIWLSQQLEIFIPDL